MWYRRILGEARCAGASALTLEKDEGGEEDGSCGAYHQDDGVAVCGLGGGWGGGCVISALGAALGMGCRSEA